ncbi:MAG: hypothetical protein ABI039_08230 [Vicinamibacterales bacterium]
MTTNRSAKLTRTLQRHLLRVEAGAIGGLIGAVAVALFFFVQGATHLHPLAVPSALTSAWVGGVSGSSAAAARVGSDAVNILQVLVYTVLHLVAFAVVGMSAAFALDGSRFWRSVWGGAAYVGGACTALLYIVSWITDTPLAPQVLGLGRVLFANMLAGAIIGVALYMVEHGDHPNVAV